MHIAYYNEYSTSLNRNMEFKVYGHSGLAMLIIPAQDGRFYDYENFKMIESAATYIERGLVQFFCVDSIDEETFSSQGDEHYRIARHEQYVNYIVYDVVNKIKAIQQATDPNNAKLGSIMISGCSMGASHALNIFLRYPECFSGVLAQSGIYHAGYFFKDYQDGRIYENSPLDYLANMNKNHPYIQRYQERLMIISVGQGRFEEECIVDCRKLQALFNELGLSHPWFDYWGYDVDHDWQWWRVQLYYFLAQCTK